MNTDRDNPHYGPAPDEIARMQAAFTKVQNPMNWKLEINAVIAIEDREITARAITFYTGSVARFSGSGTNGTLRVRAKGYYKAVGA